MPEPMEIDFLPMPSWALVSTNNGGSNNISPIEPIKLHSVPQWGHTLMDQLRHTAVEINSLRCQMQGDETDAYRIFMQMQNDYHKIETNLTLAIAQAQQHAADATGAHFNLTTTQFAEVAAAHMALRRHVETITISTAESENEDKSYFGTSHSKWRQIKMSGLLTIRTRQLSRRNLTITANDGPQRWMPGK
jgi:RNA:NAD 2'-phosphotransferase (TPT1/KptA family)